MSLFNFKKNTQISDKNFPSPIPGALVLVVWGFYKSGFFTENQAKQFWNEIKNKTIPQNANEFIDELDKMYNKVKNN